MVPDGSASPQPQHDATVVVADVSGFTALAETLDPEAVTELINRCLSALEDVVSAHGGMVEQYIGDCVLAVFGLGETGDRRRPPRRERGARDARGHTRDDGHADGRPWRSICTSASPPAPSSPAASATRRRGAPA